MAVNDPLDWAGSWQALLIQHTPFRGSESDDFQELLRQLGDIESIFIANPSLYPYYAECMGLSVEDAGSLALSQTVNIAARQVQLMEDAYFSLRLGHYANAPDNRGWMNLFRSWARSPTFREHFQRSAPTFAARFVEFYRQYIEGWQSIDEDPVPHPWDVSPELPENEQPPLETLLPEELVLRDNPQGMAQELTKLAIAHETGEAHRVPFYCGQMVKTVEKARAPEMYTRKVKGVYLDRGRREAGTSAGQAPGNRQDAAEAIPREHGETEPPTTGGSRD